MKINNRDCASHHIITWNLKLTHNNNNNYYTSKQESIQNFTTTAINPIRKKNLGAACRSIPRLFVLTKKAP